MGIYTGMRCKVIIKEEYREELSQILLSELSWADSSIDLFKEHGNYSRMNSITSYSCLDGMPDEWEDEVKTKKEGFERRIDLNNGYFTFQCSLKNYDSTIQYFFKNILSKIVEEIMHLEVYYQENAYSTSYKLVDGEIVEDNNKFKQYDDEY